MVIEKKYHFYAAHRNKNAGVKCGRIHGHTYYVECFFKFDEMENGITMLFSDIDKIVEPIIKDFDHYFLLWENDELCEMLDQCGEVYKKLPFETSCENVAMYLFNRIKGEGKLPIYKIEVAETTSSKIIYEK
jgi:6-pyruvoyl tetrahydropterin synthase/QueD family protein